MMMLSPLLLLLLLIIILLLLLLSSYKSPFIYLRIVIRDNTLISTLADSIEFDLRDDENNLYGVGFEIGLFLTTLDCIALLASYSPCPGIEGAYFFQATLFLSPSSIGSKELSSIIFSLRVMRKAYSCASCARIPP